MSLQERLMEDRKQAMREKEEGKLKLSVIRMTRAAIKNEEINKKAELNDEQVEDIVIKEVKKRKDALVEYEKAGRPDEVEKLEQEINILMDYLPKQLSEEELTLIITNAINEVNPSSHKDQGKVMAKLMPLVKGKADGKIVGNLVKELIEKKIAE
jgi:uncharacterized protein YqeY